MIDYTPAREQLGHTAPLDRRASFPLLGLPVEIRSNSDAVIAAAERSFGGWKDLEPTLIEQSAPLIVSIVVHDDLRAADLSNAPWVQRIHSECFIASSGANVITAQINHGFALGFVTPALVADDLSFRYHVLECLSLLLVGWRDRTPIHAGALVRNGRALLLVGASTAGKSTLCYAGLRAGFQLLAEDVVYVSLSNGLRLWGSPWNIHLLPDAPQIFPELVSYAPQLRANGKRKLVVDVASFGAERMCRTVERGAVCLLQRDERRASAIEEIDPQIAKDALSRDLEAGFDLFQDAHEATNALIKGGAYRLTVGNDLDLAVALLREVADLG